MESIYGQKGQQGCFGPKGLLGERGPTLTKEQKKELYSIMADIPRPEVRTWINIDCIMLPMYIFGCTLYAIMFIASRL